MNESSLNRRNFLKGAGIALALPSLESLSSQKASAAKTPKRFVSIYHPDGVGVPRRDDPAYEDWSWFPHGGEKDFKLTRVLDVLEPLRQDITIYTGLSHPACRGVHGHNCADQYLTGAPIGNEIYKNSVSMDQVYARVAGKFTRHSSLVLSTNGGTGAPHAVRTQSFNYQGRAIPAMNKPRQIFNYLFQAQGKTALAELQRNKSILDVLMENAASYKRRVSKQDKETLEEYLDAVRETEVKVVKAQDWVDIPLPKVDGSKLNLEYDPHDARVYLQTMYELIYLALLTDSTRVVTYQLGMENGYGIHDYLSKAVGFKSAHRLTHEVKKPGGWKNLGTYNRFQAEEFGRFVKRLKDTKEPNGEGSMLDNTFAMHGSASSSFHLARNYPIISAGGANLGFKNGRYLKYGTGHDGDRPGAGIVTDAGWRSDVDAEEEALGHLFVTVLQRLGVETEEFAGVKGGLDKV